MKYYVYPPKAGSMSARFMAEALDGRVLKLTGSRFRAGPGKTVINWGNSHCPYDAVNNNVNTAISKIDSFRMFMAHGVSHPAWTESKDEAMEWIRNGETVFARTLLRANSGRGIVVLNDSPDTDAPLYVKYKKKRKEFRVHVIDGTVVKVQEKRKSRDGVADNRIRSHDNGYVFCVSDIVEPDDLRSCAIAAVRSLGLVFGAVDIIWNQHENKSYVLEVNTAPGNEEPTAVAYAAKFKEMYENAN